LLGRNRAGKQARQIQNHGPLTNAHVCFGENIDGYHAS
jgi:hypothetical protein